MALFFGYRRIQMKLLILNYEFPPVGGGGGVASLQLAREFVRKGWQVDVIASGFSGLSKFENVNGIRVYRVPVVGRRHQTHSSMLALFTYVLSAFFLALRLCRREKYDHINSHFAVPTGPLGHVLSRLYRITHTLSIHGGDIYDPSKKASPHRHWWLRKTVSYVLNTADHIIAQSQDTKKNAMKLYSPKKKIHVVPLPFEPIEYIQSTRAELGLEENIVYMIAVGRLIRRKGFDDIARALTRLPENIHALIIGEGPERQYFQKIASEQGVSERFHLLGFVEEQKKMQLLEAADMYVLSSWHEGFGIVLQEAMQAGLPILAADNGGQTDIIVDGVNGFYIRSHDPKSIATGVKKIIENAEMAQQISNTNRVAVVQFRADEIVQHYCDIMTS